MRTASSVSVCVVNVVLKLPTNALNSKHNLVGPLGMAFFIINVAACLSAFAWLCVAVYDLYRMAKWKRLQRDAISTSLVFTIAALTMSVIQTGAESRFGFTNPPPDPGGKKDDDLSIVTVGIPIMFLLCTLSMLNVSLVWIQISSNMQKVRVAKKDRLQNITRYRNALICYYVAFLGLMAVAIAMNSFTIVCAVGAPGILFVFITYVYGGLRMRRVLRDHLAMGDSSSSNNKVAAAAIVNINPESSKVIRESLKSIEKAAFMVSFVDFNFLLWVVVWVLLGSNINSPDRQFNQIALSLLWFWATMAPISVMVYLHGAIQKKINKHLHQVLNSGNGAEDPLHQTTANQTNHNNKEALSKETSAVLGGGASATLGSSSASQNAAVNSNNHLVVFVAEPQDNSEKLSASSWSTTTKNKVRDEDEAEEPITATSGHGGD